MSYRDVDHDLIGLSEQLRRAEDRLDYEAVSALTDSIDRLLDRRNLAERVELAQAAEQAMADRLAG